MEEKKKKLGKQSKECTLEVREGNSGLLRVSRIKGSWSKRVGVDG